jgi:hypothetical protein
VHTHALSREQTPTFADMYTLVDACTRTLLSPPTLAGLTCRLRRLGAPPPPPGAGAGAGAATAEAAEAAAAEEGKGVVEAAEEAGGEVGGGEAGAGGEGVACRRAGDDRPGRLGCE